MSVGTCTTTTPQAASSAHGAGHATKGGKKGHGAGEGGVAAEGFSALLMQLGAGDADTVGEAPTDDLTSAGQDAAADLLAKDGKPAAEVATLAPEVLLAQSMQLQSGAQSAPVPVPPQVSAPTLVVADPGTPAVDTMQPVALEAATGVRPQDPVTTPTPAGAAPVAPQAMAAVKGAEAARPEAAEFGRETAASAIAPHRSVQHAAVMNMTAAQAVAAAPAIVTEARGHKSAPVEPRSDAGQGTAQALAAVGTSELGVRRAERTGETSAFGHGGRDDGAWGHQALLAAGGIDASASLTDTSAALPATPVSPEVMVAEQVNYWIGRDVQNAELKLDGLGDNPVEVSISLQGNEARVDFRTDLPQARQVLEGAVSHLKELLGNEGLVLSGVSVGSAGTDGAGSQERRSPSHGRQAVVATAAPQAVERSARPVRASGGAVDLFV